MFYYFFINDFQLIKLVQPWSQGRSFMNKKIITHHKLLKSKDNIWMACVDMYIFIKINKIETNYIK